MQYKLNYNLFYLFISLLIVLSYFLGFYFDEDAAGGRTVDFVGHEWGNIKLFSETKLSSALTDIEYRSGRTPLYLIINKFNPFTNSMMEFRISYLVFATSIPILFFVFLKKKFSSLDLSFLILLSSLLMLSPYFRTMSFWADQEGVAIFFLILSLIFLSRVQKINYYNNKNKYLFFSILVIALSSLSFYSDQKYIFLSIFIYFNLILKNDFKFFFQFSLVATICAIPALYLFYIWGGLVPVDTQFRLVFSPTGFNYFFSIIGLYLIPIFIVLVIEKKIKNLLFDLKFLDLIIFLVIAITLLITLPDSPKFSGAGIIFKFLSLMGNKFNIYWNVILFIYYLLNLFFLLLLLAIFKKSFKNYIFFAVYSLGFIWTYMVYQQYVDPLFFILIFCYFNFANDIIITNKKYIITYFLFYLLILSSALLYRNVCSVYFLKTACLVQ